MTHQALQGFPNTSQVSLHKDNEINLPLQQYLPERTVAFNFVSECTVQPPSCKSADKKKSKEVRDKEKGGK
jgi:hypothetical protein